jgi:hypothetical protein
MNAKRTAGVVASALVGTALLTGLAAPAMAAQTAPAHSSHATAAHVGKGPQSSGTMTVTNETDHNLTFTEYAYNDDDVEYRSLVPSTLESGSYFQDGGNVNNQSGRLLRDVVDFDNGDSIDFRVTNHRGSAPLVEFDTTHKYTSGDHIDLNLTVGESRSVNIATHEFDIKRIPSCASSEYVMNIVK